MYIHTDHERGGEMCTTNESLMKVHFLNVGQALCVLICDVQGNALLYDAGNNGDGDFILDYLRDNGIEKIDLLVCSHPHEDHIGSIDRVMNNFPVGTTIMSNKTYETKTYRDVIASITQNNIAVTDPIVGMTFLLGNGIVEILGPHSPEYDETNNYSVVMKVTVGHHSVLLPGDAEDHSEHEILDADQDIAADIISVSHHGSDSSNTIGWLDKAMKNDRTYCVISTGHGNRYDHPCEDIVDRYVEMDAIVRRTDFHGTLVYTIGGDSIREEIYPFVGSTGRKADAYSEEDPIQIVIDEVDKKSEYVLVRNAGNQPADISGWTLLSERGGQRFTWPDKTWIGPGEVMKITSGKAAGTGHFTMSRRNVWTNTKEDPALLLDGKGQEVDRVV